MNKKRGKYNQISVKRKLEIIEQVKQNKSVRSVAQLNDISESCIRGWIKNADLLKALLKDSTVQVRARKRLFGGGRHCQFAQLED
jgi:transposase